MTDAEIEAEYRRKLQSTTWEDLEAFPKNSRQFVDALSAFNPKPKHAEGTHWSYSGENRTVHSDFYETFRFDLLQEETYDFLVWENTSTKKLEYEIIPDDAALWEINGSAYQAYNSVPVATGFNTELCVSGSKIGLHDYPPSADLTTQANYNLVYQEHKDWSTKDT